VERFATVGAMNDSGPATDGACKVCGSPTEPAGEVSGHFSGRTFRVRRCPACGYGFIADPWTDYDAIYSDAYYAGEGADPLVDYVYEMAHQDRTIRRYEWQGILRRVRSLAPAPAGTRWLDYGCGTGGLVTFLRAEGIDAIGFEQGWSVPRLLERGVPVLTPDALTAGAGSFDVVTAIEVIEHVDDPVGELKKMAAALRPGGLLFLTTGNAAPYRDRLAEWRYVVPEIHISFFEPRTLRTAMERAGLRTQDGGYGPGWSDIWRFKLLKNLKRRSVSPLDRLVPWPVVARALEARLQLAAHPVGRAPDEAD
jgi:SAM-dependent methyltransferase